MNGRILGYNSQTGEGVISGEDNQRYTFRIIEWMEETAPMKGTAVDFLADGNVAKEVYRRVETSHSGAFFTSEKRIISTLLAFFLGIWGFHKFYLGYTFQGIIMIAITITIIGVFITIPISLIEAIIYLCHSDEEFHETYITNERTWF